MRVIKKRIYFTIYFFLFIFLAIIIRVGYVQVFKGEIYMERAFELWTRNIPVSTQRGKIYDRNGKLIVGNKLAPSLSIILNKLKIRIIQLMLYQQFLIFQNKNLAILIKMLQLR